VCLGKGPAASIGFSNEVVNRHGRLQRNLVNECIIIRFRAGVVVLVVRGNLRSGRGILGCRAG
jgi:hypothetical protein